MVQLSTLIVILVGIWASVFFYKRYRKLQEEELKEKVNKAKEIHKLAEEAKDVNIKEVHKDEDRIEEVRDL